MTGVWLHHSNRLEVLAAELAELVRADPGDPFAPERIVVPHPTIGRWLSLELARELGIAANLSFEQPAEFAWSIMRAAVPDLPREQPYKPARLRWRIHDLLPEPTGEPAKEPGEREPGEDGVPGARPAAAGTGGGVRMPGGAVGGYLRDGDPRKRLDLADRLARMYDQCLLYRPDWIREWENGSAPHWQARLWQRLVAADGPQGADHWVNALDRFHRDMRRGHRAPYADGPSAARPLDSPELPGLSESSGSPEPPGSPGPSEPPRSPGLSEPSGSLGSPEPLGSPELFRSPDSLDAPGPPRRGRSSGPPPSPPASAPSSSARDSLRPPGWPRRACFFAVPALSPSYLELLHEAARGIEIHLFLLNPCREYWGDIHTRREIDHRAEGADPGTRYLTEGNELLAAWGRAGRDSFDALVEIRDAEDSERFVAPAGPSRLAAVQGDILDLRLAGEAARDDTLSVGAGFSAEATRDDAPPIGAGLSAEAARDNTPPAGAGFPAETARDDAPPSGAGFPAEATRDDVPLAGAGFPAKATRDNASPAGASSGNAPDPRIVPTAGAGFPAETARGDILPADAGSPAGAAPEAAPRHVQAPPADDSLQIHVCHSPVREAEVLHDRLLAVFDAHPDLEPADVLVLTPDLETHGPAIEAVFAAAGRIPCDVARAREAESRTVRAFLDLLSLPGSRHGAEPVLAPLAAPAVRARFGIGEADVAVIRDWVREAGIRWGVDEAHRGEEDLPETVDHTWRLGLRRLLMGYAATDTDEPVAGLVPCRAGDGGFDGGDVNGELLGRFVSYCEGVFGLRARLGGRRPPARWGKVLRDVVRDFLADGSERVGGGSAGRQRASGQQAGGEEGRALARELADDAAAVRALIRDFENEAARAESPVPLEVVRDVLRERIRETAHGAARLADGVTVAGLGAGRIFPAGVVCAVGMNDGVFPRSPSAPSFDLVAAGRARRGDRDIRYEDRFAFLEALLAARRCFIVTCTGRGLRDDAPIPPSVLVDELKDYLGRRFPGEAIETRHPLQPFSPRYFEAPAAHRPGGALAGAAAPDREAHGTRNTRRDPEGGTEDGAETGGDLFSYSQGMCEAAEIMRAEVLVPESPSRFAGVALSEPDESRRCVDLAELAAFFANPTRFFLRERLGVRLELDDLALDDQEPFELDGLERHLLRSDIWSQMAAGRDPEQGAAFLHGSGRLPQAELGRIVHEKAREEVEPLEALLAPYRSALQAPPRPIDFELGEFRVTGVIEGVEPDGEGPAESGQCGTGTGTGIGIGEAERARMIWWRVGRLRARDRIEVWLRQLAWAAAGLGVLDTVVICWDGKRWKSAGHSFPDDVDGHLRDWLDAWWQGLAAPLPVFPETSMAFAKAIAKAPDPDDAALASAREKSRAAWFGSQYQRGERIDPYLTLVHDAGDPITDDFEELAVRLLVPLARAWP